MTVIASHAPSPLDLGTSFALPVAVMPLEGVFAPLSHAGRRFVLARHGVYLEARSQALYVRLRVCEGYLPYGVCDESIEPVHGPLPMSIARELQRVALDANPLETAALVIADARASETYAVHVPAAHATAGSVTYDDAGYDPSMLVLDVHSHGSSNAFFSDTDNRSDSSRMGPHVSIVFGRCASSDSMVLCARVCIGNYLIDIPANVLEGMFA